MIYLLSLITLPFWMFPVLTANLAKRLGRPYKKWLVLGFVLPVVAVVILMLLPDLSEKVETSTGN